MHCVHCGQRIGAFRAFWGSRFCSANHRAKHADSFAYEERWCDEHNPAPREREGAGRSAVLFGIFAAVFAVLLLLAPAGGRRGFSSLPPMEPSVSLLARVFGQRRPVEARDNFHKGWSDWQISGQATGWTSARGRTRPAELRIWLPSASLSDYEFEFVGQIERKSLNWAFRASDPRHYYGAKLMAAASGPSSKSELVRFVVVDGRVLDRTRIPLSIGLARNRDYRIRMDVRDHEFLASVDGQVVSSWRDFRIAKGGIGFFSDSGESSLLKWVAVKEYDNGLSRLLSHFSLIVLPTLPMGE